MRRMALILSVAAVALCAGNAAPGMGKPQIEYEVNGCADSCPAYRVAVWKNGQGMFTGIRNTRIMGAGPFSMTEQQYSAFEGALDPHRPSGKEKVYGPGSKLCAEVVADKGSVDVRWGGGNHLHYDYGCDAAKNEAMASELANAPRTLPIAAMIGAAR